MAIKTEETKTAISEGMQAKWDERYRQEILDQIRMYGFDVLVDRFREELEAVRNGDRLPPKGDRRELVRTLVRIVQREENT